MKISLILRVLLNLGTRTIPDEASVFLSFHTGYVTDTSWIGSDLLGLDFIRSLIRI